MYALTDLIQVEMECGQVVVRRVDADDYDDGAEVDGEDAVIEVGLPELVKPGFSEFVMFEKQVRSDLDRERGCKKYMSMRQIK